MVTNKLIAQFQNDVLTYYRTHGRHDLPWRKTVDPYRILVSEVMLQQTQVPRVIEKYKEFLETFPDVGALANAPLSAVLKVWSGMGYNRRGKYLRDAAICIVEKYSGVVPVDSVTLKALPGIGPYTASAILIFAHNSPDTLIETNVRTAFIHAFFKTTAMADKKISDRELLPLIARAAEGQDPREWHWALMDYGSHLKKIHTNPSRRSAHHSKQSRFKGSLREVRGLLLRLLNDSSQTEASLFKKVLAHDVSIDTDRYQKALAGLARDEMIVKQRGKWSVR
jgi:A/G-specific adenine glycosylase